MVSDMRKSVFCFILLPKSPNFNHRGESSHESALVLPCIHSPARGLKYRSGVGVDCLFCGGRLAMPGRDKQNLFHAFLFGNIFQGQKEERDPWITFLFMELHVGHMIKAIFETKPRSCTVSWFARQLNCDRRNVYDIFNRRTIDTELLSRIGRILDYDFFAEISKRLYDK